MANLKTWSPFTATRRPWAAFQSVVHLPTARSKSTYAKKLKALFIKKEPEQAVAPSASPPQQGNVASKAEVKYQTAEAPAAANTQPALPARPLIRRTASGGVGPPVVRKMVSKTQTIRRIPLKGDLSAPELGGLSVSQADGKHNIPVESSTAATRLAQQHRRAVQERITAALTTREEAPQQNTTPPGPNRKKTSNIVPTHPASPTSNNTTPPPSTTSTQHNPPQHRPKNPNRAPSQPNSQPTIRRIVTAPSPSTPTATPPHHARLAPVRAPDPSSAPRMQNPTASESEANPRGVREHETKTRGIAHEPSATRHATNSKSLHAASPISSETPSPAGWAARDTHGRRGSGADTSEPRLGLGVRSVCLDTPVECSAESTAARTRSRIGPLHSQLRTLISRTRLLAAQLRALRPSDGIPVSITKYAAKEVGIQTSSTPVRTTTSAISVPHTANPTATHTPTPSRRAQRTQRASRTHTFRVSKHPSVKFKVKRGWRGPRRVRLVRREVARGLREEVGGWLGGG